MNENLRVGNAAGTIKTLEEVERACKSAMTEITVGSITLKKQEGNTADSGFGRLYYYHPTEHWSLNSLGMPNMGLTELLKVLPTMKNVAHSSGKKLRVSVAGYKPEEYATLTEECYTSGADEVELNLGCPNVWGPDGTQKPIPSYDPKLTEQILGEVRVRIKQTVGVKISPVTRMDILQALLYKIRTSSVVSHVVACNTNPNQERLGEDGNPALSFNNGNHKGGLAGTELSKKSEQVCDYARQALHDDIEVVTVGGIFSGTDLRPRLEKGASGFQCATAYLQQREKIFSDILLELAHMAT